ncbi:hypothetical protein K458DRAFT_474802 [Lentithecium fluviatile CBS 122367]|uniref:Sm domain-containing protein n=1 Tax=Lentithecium fluviatile CBS 122367 TaxID=1168545 RepID=A0A6G1JF79_9PLEO|nr:hypothetical protein K458DRAFT_474802 [Lentithecium fluviatile CBS 122367]
MAYNPNPPHGGPAGAPPNLNNSFNQMLQRSMQEQGQQEPLVEAPGNLPPSIGYGGVYNATPPPQPHTQGALGARGPPPQQILPFDLPPQAFLTSSMLLDMVDKKVDVLLRDEKEYIGILRSYDQFANLVLTECSERIAALNPEAASDPTIPRWLISDVKLPGVLTIRGENVTICATVDLDREDTPKGAKFVPQDEVKALAATQRDKKKDSDARKAKALRKAGIEPAFGMHA